MRAGRSSESGATCMQSACTSLNFGCFASHSQPNRMLSEVVRCAPAERIRSNAYILHAKFGENFRNFGDQVHDTVQNGWTE